MIHGKNRERAIFCESCNEKKAWEEKRRAVMKRRLGKRKGDAHQISLV